MLFRSELLQLWFGVFYRFKEKPIKEHLSCLLSCVSSLRGITFNANVIVRVEKVNLIINFFLQSNLGDKLRIRGYVNSNPLSSEFFSCNASCSTATERVKYYLIFSA